MKVRSDIAHLLHNGHSNTHIAQQLDIHRRHVAAARKALHIPNTGVGGRKPAASPEDMFWQRVTLAPDGHALWKGHRNSNGCPVFRYQKRAWSAYRIAFLIRHGRDPEGRVRAGCGRDECVAPDHVEDRRIRERVESIYDSIFGR